MLFVESSICDECGTCISVCPVNALLLTEKLEIDHDCCTQCGTCVNICPFGALSIKNE